VAAVITTTGKLIHVGRVGTGFSDTVAAALTGVLKRYGRLEDRCAESPGARLCPGRRCGAEEPEDRARGRVSGDAEGYRAGVDASVKPPS
jgi:hypothetical protein